MYNYIKGNITEVSENFIVVECGGIGYEIFASLYSIDEFNKIKSDVKVYTYLNVKEDEMSLYGFFSKSEKAMFLRLISISGIGPKLALSVLSGVSVSALANSIACGDLASLNKIKGIGKKTAERIVLELKDKISAEFDVKLLEGGTAFAISSADEDAVIALMSLGYTKQEATIGVAKVQKEGMSTEQIIMQALKGGN